MAPVENELQELQEGLKYHSDVIDQLRTVLQVEQERASAAEATAAAERAKLEELSMGVRSMKVLRQQDINSLATMRTDLGALEQRLSGALSRLESHDGEHASAGGRLEALDALARSLQQRVEQLEGHSEAASAGLGVADERAGQQAISLSELERSLAELRCTCEAADERGTALAAAQRETARSLQEALEITLPDIAEKAGSERLRLDETSAKLVAVELSQGGLTKKVNALQDLADATSAKDAKTCQSVATLNSSLGFLEGRATRGEQAAKESREQLEDMCYRANILQGHVDNIGAEQRRTHSLSEELRAQGQQHTQQIKGLVEALAVLRQELHDTDGHVGAVGTYLGIEREESKVSERQYLPAVG